jgi:hypothetical protein
MARVRTKVAGGRPEVTEGGSRGRRPDTGMIGASTSPTYSSRRHAFCPLCGQERVGTLASEARTPEAALCAGRCDIAWRVLVALRVSESESARIIARRRIERDLSQPHAATLSELLLERWRAGDWAIAPEDLLWQLS